MRREHLFAAFFFAVFLFLIYQLYLCFAPFAAPLVLAAVVVLTFYPLTERVVKALRGSHSLIGRQSRICVRSTAPLRHSFR